MKHFILQILLLIVLLAFSCKQKKKDPIAAFYHWQTDLGLSDREAQSLTNLKTKKLYTKFFDVDLDEKNKPTPLATLQCNQFINDSIEVIPTVFITNRTFFPLSSEEIRGLSGRVLKKINLLWSSVSKNKIREIQFDCDWTPTTKEKYFTFLRYFREELERKKNKEIILSATIRLHQVKYAKETGVPPVNRGMLMFYNMDDLESIETTNSILNLKLAKQYLNKNTSYEIPLDIALPIFRWGVLFRNDKMIKLINNLEAADLKDINRFSARTRNQYEVLTSTYLKGYYLYAKDVIRLEWVSSDELLSAADFLSDIFYNNKNTVSLYQLDSNTLKHYSDETLQQVFQHFSD